LAETVQCGGKLKSIFFILDETSKSFPKFNATGRSLLINFRLPCEEQEPTAYLKVCTTALINYIVDDMRDSYLLGLRIRNTENVQVTLVVLILLALTNLNLICSVLCWVRSFRVMRILA